jgi:hypothetical protein
MFCPCNLPGYSKNQIVVKNDTFTCAVNSIIIKLDGIAHAGEPEKDQILAIASIIPNSILLFRLTFQGKLLSDHPIYTKMGKRLMVFLLELRGSFYSEKRQ